MCTVTYLPKGKNSFILSSSRDEKALRKPAEPPSFHEIDGRKILFPRDPQGGGTWIAVSDRGRTICLLNGAFEKHISKPPYRKSRGLVALDALMSVSLYEFQSSYALSGIEPFTLVEVYEESLKEFRWDGKKSYLKIQEADRTHIWSSATLYSEEIIGQREKWFESWLKENQDLSQDAIRHFHHSGGKEDSYNGIRINRENFMLTLSITTVSKKGNDVSMIYEDLMEDKIYRQDFKTSL
ncbi:MAG: NRDE family protein [Cytophagaceae bacterium]